MLPLHVVVLLLLCCCVVVVLFFFVALGCMSLYGMVLTLATRQGRFREL